MYKKADTPTVHQISRMRGDPCDSDEEPWTRQSPGILNPVVIDIFHGCDQLVNLTKFTYRGHNDMPPLQLMGII